MVIDIKIVHEYFIILTIRVSDKLLSMALIFVHKYNSDYEIKYSFSIILLQSAVFSAFFFFSFSIDQCNTK